MKQTRQQICSTQWNQIFLYAKFIKVLFNICYTIAKRNINQYNPTYYMYSKINLHTAKNIFPFEMRTCIFDYKNLNALRIATPSSDLATM